jgi:hypothetical protein
LGDLFILDYSVVLDGYRSDFTNTLVVGGSNNDSYTNPDNRHFDRGNCTLAATDRRHLFNLSAVASTPTPTRTPRAPTGPTTIGYRFLNA